MRRVVSLLLLFVAGPAFGQDVALVLKGQFDLVKVTRLVPVVEDREAVKAFPFTLEAPANAIRPSWIVPAGVTWSAKARVLTVSAAPKGEITISAEWSVIDFVKQTITDQTGFRTFLIGDAPQPAPPKPPVPPVPPPPDPKPPFPPQPVISFRVIFVSESAKTLTKEQNSVIAGKAVWDWLTANTTQEGSSAGWRHYDPQQTVANELLNMRRLWEAVQPKLSALPCVVIEVNGRAEIIPLAATPAEMLETFRRYKSGIP